MRRMRQRNYQLNCEGLESRRLMSGYYIVNASSGKVLDDPNSSTSNGTGMEVGQLNGGANQQWTFVPLADGNDLIVDPNTGTVLDDFYNGYGGGFTLTSTEWSELGATATQEWQIFQRTRMPDFMFFGHIHRPAAGVWRGIPFHIQRATSHQVAFDLTTSAYIPGTHESPDYSLVTVTGRDIVILQRSFLYDGPTFSLDSEAAQAASFVGELQR